MWTAAERLPVTPRAGSRGGFGQPAGCVGRDTGRVSHEVFRHRLQPFPNGVFPADLGAVVQRTVLNGSQPARVVIHDGDGYWLVGDGISDPNEPGACVVACIAHVADADPAVATLATLPAGQIAERDDPGAPWRIAKHEYSDE